MVTRDERASSPSAQVELKPPAYMVREVFSSIG